MEDFLRNKNLIHALKMISPGSPLRQGLDNILKAKTGGLIVIATGEEIMEVVDGGFCINAEYSPAYIYELAKIGSIPPEIFLIVEIEPVGAMDKS